MLDVVRRAIPRGIIHCKEGREAIVVVRKVARGHQISEGTREVVNTRVSIQTSNSRVSEDSHNYQLLTDAYSLQCGAYSVLCTGSVPVDSVVYVLVVQPHAGG